jgi:hypothetical protein
MNTPGIKLDKVGIKVYIIGNTYSVKDVIKSQGGKWDNDKKAWWFPVSKEDVAANIVRAHSKDIGAREAARNATTRYHKIDDATWGVTGPRPFPKPGDEVTVTKGSGDKKVEVIESIESIAGDFYLARIVFAKKTRKPRAKKAA